jgi:hypothetical protein
VRGRESGVRSSDIAFPGCLYRDRSDLSGEGSDRGITQAVWRPHVCFASDDACSMSQTDDNSEMIE